MALLPYQPQHSSAFSVKPKVKKVSFGDGYEQRFLNEIHPLRKQYSLVFTLSESEGITLRQFFENLAGINHFQWQGPEDSSPVNYICDDWQYSLIPFKLMRINANIRRVYEA